jgi:hypothetical protein
VNFAAIAGHRCGRATPSLRDAPQRQSMERIGRESIYRDRNAVQTNPATSLCVILASMGSDSFSIDISRSVFRGPSIIGGSLSPQVRTLAASRVIEGDSEMCLASTPEPTPAVGALPCLRP